MSNVLAIGMPGGADWIIIAAIGLLLFGKRLPEVGRSLGKGIVEFKKGLKGVDDDVAQVDPRTSPTPMTHPALPGGTSQSQFKFDPYTGKAVLPDAPAGAKFDPYTGKPIESTTTVSAGQSTLDSHGEATHADHG